MKRIVVVLVAMGALMAFATQANAQIYFRSRGYGQGGYGQGGYGQGGYGQGGYGQGGYGGNGFGYGGGWGQPSSYFGNGGHDFQQHWHVTRTPFGQQMWYGNGPHDSVPHQHSQTPWSYQGNSNTGAGPTTSFYAPQPYYYAPW